MNKILIGAMALALLGGSAAMAQPYDAGHDGHHDGGGQYDHRDGGDRHDGGGYDHRGGGDRRDGWRRHHRSHLVCNWRHHHKVCHRVGW